MSAEFKLTQWSLLSAYHGLLLNVFCIIIESFFSCSAIRPPRSKVYQYLAAFSDPTLLASVNVRAEFLPSKGQKDLHGCAFACVAESGCGAAELVCSSTILSRVPEFGCEVVDPICSSFILSRSNNCSLSLDNGYDMDRLRDRRFLGCEPVVVVTEDKMAVINDGSEGEEAYNLSLYTPLVH